MAEHNRLGKQTEYYVVSLMLKEGLEVFLPAADDNGIDAVVKKPDGKYAEIQIKAKAKDAFFAAIKHEYRENYWFVFYCEIIDKILLLSSNEFLKEAVQNKDGENVGKWSIKFNGEKNGEVYILERFQKYIATDFSRIKNENPNKGGENASL